MSRPGRFTTGNGPVPIVWDGGWAPRAGLNWRGKPRNHRVRKRDLVTILWIAYRKAKKFMSLRFLGLFTEGKSISKLQIVIEKNRMEIMTYKQHLFFNVISKQI